MTEQLRIQRYIERFPVKSDLVPGGEVAEQTWRLNGLPLRFLMGTVRYQLQASDIKLQIFVRPPSADDSMCGRDHWCVQGDANGVITKVDSWWFDTMPHNRHHSSKAETDFFLLDPTDAMIDLFGITYRVNDTLSYTVPLRSYLESENRPTDFTPTKAICTDNQTPYWIQPNDERPDVIGKP